MKTLLHMTSAAWWLVWLPGCVTCDLDLEYAHIPVDLQPVPASANLTATIGEETEHATCGDPSPCDAVAVQVYSIGTVIVSVAAPGYAAAQAAVNVPTREDDCHPERQIPALTIPLHLLSGT